jgi:hypothetical protein
VINASCHLLSCNLQHVILKKLQDDYSEMKFNIEATKKALGEIEQRRQRQKRDSADDDIEESTTRLYGLSDREGRISELASSIKDLMQSVKAQVKEAKEQLKR